MATPATEHPGHTQRILDAAAAFDTCRQVVEKLLIRLDAVKVCEFAFERADGRKCALQL